MSTEQVNRSTYEKPANVASYTTWNSLMRAEVLVFLEYKERIWRKRILDIGCGAGRTTDFLSGFTDDYTGIDYSETAIRLCRKRFGGLPLFHCDARDLRQFEDGRFDFVLFSANGIDSMGDADRQRCLGEIHRVLAGQGIFVFSSHNRNFLMKTRKGRVPPPRLRWSSSPVQQVRNVRDFFISTYNYNRNRKFERFDDDYALVPGIAHNYGLLTHYINRHSQIARLEKAGLRVIATHDRDGTRLAKESDDSASTWIYYVAEKPD